MADSDWHEVSYKKRRSVFERMGSTLNVYVSNFPSHLSLRELSNICGKKGHIVDVFIAKHKNKFGQSFGFCRFNGVDNKENLIASLNKVRIGKLNLHANIARFDRYNGTPKNAIPVKKIVESKVPAPVASSSAKKVVSESNSFVNVVKGDSSGDKMGSIAEDCTSFIASQDTTDMELVILGCHKDFRSIENSKIICNNEGFLGVDVKYLGGLWVMFSFDDMDARNSFLTHEGVLSWFSVLVPWDKDFVLNERLVWLEIEGIPIRAWHNDTFKGLCKKWGEVLFIDDSDASNRFSIRLCLKTTYTSLIFASTLVTLNGVTYAYRVRELCSWVPSFAPPGDSDENVPDDKSSNSSGDMDDEIKVQPDNEFEGYDAYVPHSNKDDHSEVKATVSPSNSDPFNLEPLIVKNGNYHHASSDPGTPLYPPGFTQSENVGNYNEVSDACKSKERLNSPSLSQHSQWGKQRAGLF
ncbi:hypothetical protein CTI12_AA565510 [Artemisia annua]|uniref:RRM domain-containing protein n=1 Tax=Artemisia annua TaxID=35608 RepID=A0A2U1KTS3_ARTAN|nr:hypothetical protein CTI12_AA565510 [Artemisia annua]